MAKAKILALASMAALALLVGHGAMAAEMGHGVAVPKQLGFQEAVTPVMERLNHLHNYLLVIISCVTVVVMALLAYVCIRFRRSANPYPSKTSHNTMVEIVWTVVPILILVAIAVPSIRLHYYMDEAVDPEMTIKVTGFQWYWGYEFPDQGVERYLSNIRQETDPAKGEIFLLSVDNPLVVPVDTVVRVQVTAADVIHAWAVPAFGVKVDAVPGRLNETWFKATKPGVYYGQCSELCGINHGFMPIEVHVVEKPVFEAWVERAKAGEYAMQGIELSAAVAPADAKEEEKEDAAPAQQ